MEESVFIFPSRYSIGHPSPQKIAGTISGLVLLPLSLPEFGSYAISCLKPNMIISGAECSEQADVNRVADMTFKCLKDNVPAEVPGIAFLSGGQSSNDATAHLCRMNEKYSSDMPWNMTFSYGRALQNDSLNSWAGSNRLTGQEALINRAKANSQATFGKALSMS